MYGIRGAFLLLIICSTLQAELMPAIGDGVVGITDPVFEFAVTTVEGKYGESPQGQLAVGVLEGAQGLVGGLMEGIFGTNRVPEDIIITTDQDPPVNVSTSSSPDPFLMMAIMMTQQSQNQCSWATNPREMQWCQCRSNCVGSSPVITPMIEQCVANICNAQLTGINFDAQAPSMAAAQARPPLETLFMDQVGPHSIPVYAPYEPSAPTQGASGTTGVAVEPTSGQ